MATQEDLFLERLLSVPEITSAGVSPDGQWVAWTWYNLEPAGNVFATKTDGSSPVVQLSAEAENTWFVSWHPTGRSVLLAQDQGGDERVHLMQVNLQEPCKLFPLTAKNPPYFMRGGEISSDGSWFVYAANYDPLEGKVIEASSIIRQEIASGAQRVLACTKRASWTKPKINAQGTQVLYERCDLHPGGIQVWLVSSDGSGDCEILNFGPAVKIFPTWCANGREVFFTAEAQEYVRVGVWHPTAGVRWLIDDPRRFVEEAYVPRGGREGVIIERSDSRPRAFLIDIESGRERCVAPPKGSLLPLGEGIDGRWVGMYYHACQPQEIVGFSDHTQGSTAYQALSRVWTRVKIKEEGLIGGQIYSWKSVDGEKIQGWLYEPRTKPQGSVIIIHGGPTGVSEDLYSCEVQFYLSQGFLVLLPNYRGSTGFGLRFRELIKADGWGGLEQDDIRTGIEALLSDGLAKPFQVGVTGLSYGGYSSWCQITRCPRELVAAAIPVCGMTDLVVDYETTRPDLRMYSEEMMGGAPTQVPQMYRERSPLHFVQNIRGKLLIVQGLRDPNVTPENVRVVEGALKAARVSYELLTFDDEGHGITRPENLRTFYLRAAQFFRETFR